MGRLHMRMHHCETHAHVLQWSTAVGFCMSTQPFLGALQLKLEGYTCIDKQQGPAAGYMHKSRCCIQ